MKRIEKITEFEEGKSYHCFDENSFEHDVYKHCGDVSGTRVLEVNRVWGPIEPPQVGGMFLCPEHGGHGFHSDCYRCQYLAGHKEGE